MIDPSTPSGPPRPGGASTAAVPGGSGGPAVAVRDRGSAPDDGPPGPRRSGSRFQRALPYVVGVLAIVAVVMGIVLVVEGGDDGAPTGPTTTAGSGTAPSLPLDDTTQASIEELAGILLPTGTTDFLSARLDDGSQLDVTFTIPVDGLDALVSASGLPTPVAGARQILHSSPLWKLNPEGAISGAADVHGDVARVIEVVPEGDRLRVRLVLTPAPQG